LIKRPENFPFHRWINALLDFTWQETASCFFAVYILLMLMVTRYFPLPAIARYDAMLILCIVMQVAMVWIFKIETVDELKVICLFHLLGTSMEIFKVHMGSWSYPGDAYTKLFGVPLYGGFMYASVASYITQAWRRLDLHLTNFPPDWINFIIAVAIYFNFFTHHFIYDFRYVILIVVLIIYWNAKVNFTTGGQTFQMPIKLAFLLTGFFIWLAENIATFFGAWQYPNQTNNWKLVHPGKVTSWLLLFIVSFVIVAQLKRIKAKQQRSGTF
jgi:uncharacterized membrane protein YoaT (DUF817 family)